MSVLATAQPTFIGRNEACDPRIRWCGPDDRGVALEVVALDELDRVVVIHAMPMVFRERSHP